MHVCTQNAWATDEHPDVKQASTNHAAARHAAHIAVDEAYNQG